MHIYGLTKNKTLSTGISHRNSGKAARDVVPFSDQAKFNPVDRDPVALIEEQNKDRLPHLIPLRKERMSMSAFAFYRGTALLMAHDLAQQTITGTQLIICGDAHISNFGLYASPERRLVFDLNDFDEAAPGPWEWDLKRLVTSVILGGENKGLCKSQTREAALQAVSVTGLDYAK